MLDDLTDFGLMRFTLHRLGIGFSESLRPSYQLRVFPKSRTEAEQASRGALPSQTVPAKHVLALEEQEGAHVAFVFDIDGKFIETQVENDY